MEILDILYLFIYLCIAIMAIKRQSQSRENPSYSLPPNIRKKETCMNDAISSVLQKFSAPRSKPSTEYYGGIWDIGNDCASSRSNIRLQKKTVDWWGNDDDDDVKETRLPHMRYNQLLESCSDEKETAPQKNITFPVRTENYPIKCFASLSGENRNEKGFINSVEKSSLPDDGLKFITFTKKVCLDKESSDVKMSSNEKQSEGIQRRAHQDLALLRKGESQLKNSLKRISHSDSIPELDKNRLPKELKVGNETKAGGKANFNGFLDGFLASCSEKAKLDGFGYIDGFLEGYMGSNISDNESAKLCETILDKFKREVSANVDPNAFLTYVMESAAKLKTLKEVGKDAKRNISSKDVKKVGTQSESIVNDRDNLTADRLDAQLHNYTSSQSVMDVALGDKTSMKDTKQNTNVSPKDTRKIVIPDLKVDAETQGNVTHLPRNTKLYKCTQNPSAKKIDSEKLSGKRPILNWRDRSVDSAKLSTSPEEDKAYPRPRGRRYINYGDPPTPLPYAKDEKLRLKLTSPSVNVEFSVLTDVFVERKRSYLRIGDFLPEPNTTTKTIPYSAPALVVVLKFLFGGSYRLSTYELGLEVYAIAKKYGIQFLLESCCIYLKDKRISDLDEALRITQLAGHLGLNEDLKKFKQFEPSLILLNSVTSDTQGSFEAYSCSISCATFQKTSEFVIPLTFFRDHGLGSTMKSDLRNDITFKSSSGTYHLKSIQLKLVPEDVKEEKLSIFYDIFRNGKLEFDDECQPKMQSLIIIKFSQELIVRSEEEIRISVVIEDIPMRFCYSLLEEKIEASTSHGKCVISFESARKSEAKNSLFFIEKLFYTVSE